MEKVVVIKTNDVIFLTGHNGMDGGIFCHPPLRQEGVNMCGGGGFGAMVCFGMSGGGCCYIFLHHHSRKGCRLQ